ncbi:MAG: hypothetical protein J0H09_05860 [Burkholderiales bacterium]|nr:hypothetical protein [Burkholderiales bacterium]
MIIQPALRGCAAAWVFALATALAAPATAAKEPPPLTAAERRALLQAAGMKEQKGQWLNGCGHRVEPELDVVDLNDDGRAEVFITDDDACYGSVGSMLTLMIRDRSGRWRVNLGFPASGYRVLKTGQHGYPDIEIEGPGACFPVWRWNGREYDIHKRCRR